jgi:hypothetical protein
MILIIFLSLFFLSVSYFFMVLLKFFFDRVKDSFTDNRRASYFEDAYSQFSRPIDKRFSIRYLEDADSQCLAHTKSKRNNLFSVSNAITTDSRRMRTRNAFITTIQWRAWTRARRSQGLCCARAQ